MRAHRDVRDRSRVADKIYAGGRLLGAYEADLVDQVVEFVGTTSANTESWANPTVLARVTTANGAPTTAPMAVTYATVDGSGSATAGADYVSKSAVHTVPAGTLSGTTFSLQFNVLNDAMDEPDETVLLRLTSATNGTIGAAHTLTYSILDDDAPPTIEAVALATVGEAQSAQATVTLSAPSGFAVQATVTLASGTALAGYDFSGRAPGGHGHARPPDGIRDGAAGQRRVGGADGGTVLLHPVESCSMPHPPRRRVARSRFSMTTGRGWRSNRRTRGTTSRWRTRPPRPDLPPDLQPAPGRR